MMKKIKHNQNGFTLIETVVAILILSLTIGALLTLTANGIFSVRYARNQIVANNLAQESLEFIRASRDTMRQQHALGQSGTSWSDWLATLNVNVKGQPNPDYTGTPQGCFSTGNEQGCIVDPYVTDGAQIWQMSNAGSCAGSYGSIGYCPNIWYYPQTGYYGYPARESSGSILTIGTPVMTTYKRWVNVALLPGDSNQLTVTATVEWYNGITQRSLTQSMILTNWSQ